MGLIEFHHTGLPLVSTATFLKSNMYNEIKPIAGNNATKPLYRKNCCDICDIKMTRRSLTGIHPHKNTKSLFIIIRKDINEPN